MDSNETKQSLSSLQDELDGAALYRALAEQEKDPKIAEVYRRMAATESRHAATWTERLQEAGVTVPEHHLSWRTRTMIWLSQRFGSGFVLPTIVDQEQADMEGYRGRPNAVHMAADESSHARMLRYLEQGGTGGIEGGRLARLEGRHRTAGGNALRAAVLGVDDGLVSNLSLVMGVSGAQLTGHAVLITGLAGMLAGSCAMALGEWLSVQSSRELYAHQIGIEKAEILNAPEEEAEELALIYQARGIEEDQAKHLAGQIIQDQGAALETLAREELSINPEELGGSAWEAAVASFVMFSVGAIVPVSPFIFLHGTVAVVLSIVLSMIGLFIIGAGITLFTGRSVIYSGMRQVAFGLLAAAVTYSVGRLIGVNLGG
jgi:VIT1/CCC1 family predicted Fe2+/Mn2+ transporter